MSEVSSVLIVEPNDEWRLFLVNGITTHFQERLVIQAVSEAEALEVAKSAQQVGVLVINEWLDGYRRNDGQLIKFRERFGGAISVAGAFLEKDIDLPVVAIGYDEAKMREIFFDTFGRALTAHIGTYFSSLHAVLDEISARDTVNLARN